MIVGKQDAHIHGPSIHRARRKASKRLTLALLALCLWPVAAAADCPVLSLTGPVPSKALAGYIGVHQDRDWRLTPEQAARQPDLFATIPSNIPDFGYTASRIWLRLCLVNDTADTAQWRLYTHENFFQVYAVHLARADGTLETLMDLREDSPFSARPVADPELVAPLTLAPGARADIFVAYWSGGSSKVDFSIQTEASFETIAAQKTARNFLFYGMMILLITIAFLSLLITRQPVFLAYCGYALFALLFVMHGDGVAFQFLWPTWPLFNSNASILTGSGLIVCGAIYARVFLKTPERLPRLDKLLLAMILITVALVAVLSPLNTQLLKQALVALSLLSFLVFAVSGVVAYLSGYRDVRFYALAWVGAMVSVSLMFLRHFTGIEIPQGVVHDSMRTVMVLDALMMGLAIADRYNQLRQSRQGAMQASLDAAQRALELNRRLTELQARHEMAMDLAQSRDTRLQNVAHDLRQPLHALRLSIMNLQTAPQSEPGALPRIEASFNYLDTLISRQLQADADTAPQGGGDDAPLGQPGLPEILGALQEMFRGDAEEKGLSLRRYPATFEAPGDALVLTRILSNLVSNAIKYTASGGILIGARRHGATVRVEIHDTGPGMTEAEFAEAGKRNTRLKSGMALAGGTGLGLAIAIDLARRHGMRIERSGLRRTGLGLVLVIPLR